MTPLPGNAPLAAAATAVALARLGVRLSRTVPAPRAASLACRRRCASIDRVLANQIRTSADAAAVGSRLVATLQAFARAADQSAVVEEFYDAAGRAAVAAPVSASAGLTQRYRIARALAAGVEAALLGAAFTAEGKTPLKDRKSAVAAERRIERALNEASGRISAGLGDSAMALLHQAARNISQRLMEEGASLRPLVSVKVGRCYPSTALAWRLYGDPKRARELMRRADCGTPLFMPTEFLALAP